MLYNFNLSSLYKIDPNMGDNLHINSALQYVSIRSKYIYIKKNCTEMYLKRCKYLISYNKYKIFTTQL